MAWYGSGIAPFAHATSRLPGVEATVLPSAQTTTLSPSCRRASCLVPAPLSGLFVLGGCLGDYVGVLDADRNCCVRVPDTVLLVVVPKCPGGV